jgi:hypothetical protein
MVDTKVIILFVLLNYDLTFDGVCPNYTLVHLSSSPKRSTPKIFSRTTMSPQNENGFQHYGIA